VNLNVNFNILKQLDCALIRIIKDLIAKHEYFGRDDRKVIGITK
jgi:hypothetical protein